MKVENERYHCHISWQETYQEGWRYRWCYLGSKNTTQKSVKVEFGSLAGFAMSVEGNPTLQNISIECNCTSYS